MAQETKDKTESRRKFLKTAGKFAVYAPPAIVVMAHTSEEGIASSGGGTPPAPGGQD